MIQSSSLLGVANECVGNVSRSSVRSVRGPFSCPASVSRCTAVAEAGQLVLSGGGAEVLPEILSWENTAPKWQKASEEVPVGRVPKSPGPEGPSAPQLVPGSPHLHPWRPGAPSSLKGARHPP